ncbi:MAG: enoyl-CoA hydratase family protein [Rhodococcus sp.]|nr:enoyl-CoA hydratase family protein [Rhodococcus sp. (in: high G+C Gram-positive bacteria)]
MGEPYVRYEVLEQEGRATLTLDSPHNRNAISQRLVEELHDGLAAAESDNSVRAVVLTHTGGTFCAGADLSDASGDVSTRTMAMAGLLNAILALSKPVIAQIDGHVRAGGMGLVGACDLAVAGPSSTFALTEARLGLAPSIISLTVLPRLNSRAASRYFVTGEKFGSDVAEAIGFLTAASDDPAQVAADWVRDICAGSPQGVAASKALTTRPVLADFDRSAVSLASESARLFSSEEAQEGMMAFLQKRQPRWAQ